MRQEDLHVNCRVFPEAKATFTLEVEYFSSMLKIDITGRGGNTQSIILNDIDITMLEDLLRMR